MKTTVLITLAMLSLLQADEPNSQFRSFNRDYTHLPHVLLHAKTTADIVSLMDNGKSLGRVDKEGNVTITAPVSDLDAFIAKLETGDDNHGAATVKAVAMLFRAIAIEREK